MTGDGQPVAGAKVTIHAVETPEARRERLVSASPDLVALAAAQTDAKGNFSLESPKESVVDVRVEMRGYEPMSRRVERDEELGAVAVAKREMTRGTVTAGGKPVANALVVATYDADYQVRTDEQGRYEIPDIKRARSIAVIHPDFAIDEELFMTSNTPASEANRTLSAGITLTGRVVAPDGTSPLTKATIRVDGWPVATSGDDGAFTVAHAPAKWSTLAARRDSLIGSRVSAGSDARKPLIVRMEKSAAITGRVTDIKTKLPVVGAIVRLVVPRRPSAGDVSLVALTDAKGAYSVLAPPGTYTVAASHPAFEAKTVDATVVAGQQVVKDLTMNQLARVTGVVVDEEKRPVAGAGVTAEAAGGDMGMRMPPRIVSRNALSVSGLDGRFSVRITPDSEQRLRASKKGMPAAAGEAFRLAAGERKGSVVLTIPTGIAVTGRVLDQNGEPLSGVTVSASESQGGGDGMVRRMIVMGGPAQDEDLVRSGSDGSFTLRLKEGTYDFTFRREGYAQKEVRAQSVTATASPRVEARLEPAVEISGRITRGGAGVPDVSVSAFVGSETMTTTGPDGSFTLGGLSPGVTRLMLNKQQEMVQEQRNITAPARDVNIELPVGSTIAGRVVEKGTKKGITSFSAGVSTSRGGGGVMMIGSPLLRQFTSDDGSFTLEHVPPGAVSLVASAPGYAGGRMNLDVEEGKNLTDVLVELEPGARLTGRVTSANGSPLSDVAVAIAPSATGGFAMRGAMSRTRTDANGEYVLESLEPGDETVTFSHPKHVETSKKITLKGRDNRLDVTLGAGQRLAGVVVTEAGTPVPEAEVMAFGSGGGREARTNASGTFEFESLAPGRYRFTAAKSGFAEGVVDDFDVSSGAPLRITVKTGGTIYGRVTGLPEAELANVIVMAGSGGRSSSSSPVDPQGNFRIEGAPTGTVRVWATASSRMIGSGGGRSSAPQVVELAPGGTQQVTIEFRADTVVRGRVTRNGVPLTTATVQFWPRGGTAQSTASAATDEQGNYSVSGLEPGEYNVLVRDARYASYQTTHEVRGSGTFDIEYKVGMVRGRVLNALSNDPVANASVQLRASGHAESRFAPYAGSTDPAGSFSIDSVPPGTYTVTVGGEGFANQINEISVSDAGRDGLEFRLNRDEGVRLNVVDGRDGRPLNAMVIVFDMQGRLVHEGGFRFGGGTPEEEKLPLAAGQYSATITASNYAPRHVGIKAPSGAPVTIPMTPGGTIRVASKHAGRRRIYLLDASGMPYPRWSARPTPRDLHPGTNPIERIAPGTYTLQLLDQNGGVADQIQVTVRDGDTVDASI